MSASTTDPAPVAPSPPPSLPTPPKPGFATSEAWLTLLTIVFGAIPSSGLVDNAPLLAKIVGMAIAALATLNYTAQRTSLKRAYLAARLAAGAALAALVVMLGVMQTSCSSTAACKDPKNASSVGCVVEGAVVDCTGVSSLPSAISVVGPLVDKLLASATQPDGTIAWASIEPSLVDLALQYGTCVLAEIWNAYINPGAGAGSGSVAPRLARARAVPADFAAEFDRIRAKVAPGRKFKTSGGAL